MGCSANIQILEHYNEMSKGLLIWVSQLAYLTFFTVEENKLMDYFYAKDF